MDKKEKARILKDYVTAIDAIKREAMGNPALRHGLLSICISIVIQLEEAMIRDDPNYTRWLTVEDTK